MSESQELTEALNAMLDAKRWLLESEGYTEDHKEFCRERFRAARAALVALFDRQREEREDALELSSELNQLAVKLEDQVSSLSSQLESQREEYEAQYRELQVANHQWERGYADLEAQLERLKAEQITPEEAYLLVQLESDAESLFEKGESDTAFSKLHRLSQSDTGGTDV